MAKKVTVKKNKKPQVPAVIQVEDQGSPTPATLLQMAVEKGADVGQLEKLMDLQDRWDKTQAKKAFLSAMGKFQGKLPEIKKTKAVGFAHKTGGGSTNYKYAPLPSIVVQIKGLLTECNLSYRFEIAEKDASIIVSCIVSHVDGHSETTTMSSTGDTSGNKNNIQSRGSAVTYLQRYTLIGALGITTANEDNDGKTPAVGNNDQAELGEEVLAEIERITEPKTLTQWVVDNPQYHKNLVFQATTKKRMQQLNSKK